MAYSIYVSQYTALYIIRVLSIKIFFVADNRRQEFYDRTYSNGLARTGRNGRHARVGLLRQSVFGRLAGYEDVKTPSACATIQRAGLSAGQRLTVMQHRPGPQMVRRPQPCGASTILHLRTHSAQAVVFLHRHKLVGQFACRLVHIRRGLVFGRP